MTHKLPPNLLALFAARPALRYLPPNDHAPEERKTNNIGGVAQYLSAIEDYKENVPYQPTESWLQRKDRVKLEKKEKQEQLVKEGLSQSMRFAHLFLILLVWTSRLTSTEPGDDPNVRGDAFKTLFVARLSYDTTEKDLEREFGRFGPIERVNSALSWTLESCLADFTNPDTHRRRYLSTGREWYKPKEEEKESSRVCFRGV